jgi:hypothetical protein
MSEPDRPAEVKAMPRLRQYLEALQVLTQGAQPPLRRVRGSATGCAYYGFGDASGAFGATIQIGDEAEYEYGQWSLEVVEEETSNWKDIANLVRALYRLVKEKGLQGKEIFIFTDNSTAEGAFWKGTSKSRRLFELVLELKQLEMEADLILHIIHVSGRRMIVQGTDGLSRADHSRGVMSGRPMLEFVPLHLSALDRKPDLKGWTNSVICGLDPVFLSPKGWFDEGHGRGNFVWTPPPAAAEVVVEQLGLVRLKRPESIHVIPVPRLMTGRWRKLLIRGTDASWMLKTNEVWPLSNFYEPLAIFVCFPYRSSSPNFPGKKKLLEGFAGALQKERLSPLPELRSRRVLWKLLLEARGLCPL